MDVGNPLSSPRTFSTIPSRAFTCGHNEPVMASHMRISPSGPWGPMSFITLILIFATNLISSQSFANQSQSCYAPNGELLPFHTSCNSTESDSSCCNIGDGCLVNGVCLSSTRKTVYRGGCTDRSYHSGQCPTNCLDG